MKVVILGTAHGKNVGGKRSPDNSLEEYRYSCVYAAAMLTISARSMAKTSACTFRYTSMQQAEKASGCLQAVGVPTPVRVQLLATPLQNVCMKQLRNI